MTKYYKPSTLGAPLPVKGFRSPLRPTGLAASMLVPDPLAPETTVYWDQSTGAQQPGAGGPQVASRIYYDNAISALTANNVQDAIDLIDNQLDNITGASSSLDARVDVLEVEMDTAQADITALQATDVTLSSSITTAEANITNLQGRMTTAEGSIVANSNGITALESLTAVHTADIAALDTRLDAAEASIVTLDARLDTAEPEIDALQALTATHTTDIAALDTRLDAAEANITTLQGKTGQATETTAGIAEIATTAEVTTGIDDQHIVTPAKLAARLASLPGAAPATESIAGIAEIATQAEVNAGADDARIVTPKKLHDFNGWIVGPVGIGGAPEAGAQLSVIDPSTAELAVRSTGAVQARLRLRNSNRTWLLINGLAADGNFSIYDATVGADRFQIDATGRIGIGGAPAALLHVWGDNYPSIQLESTTATHAQLVLKNITQQWIIYNQGTSGYLSLYQGGRDIVTINPGSGVTVVNGVGAPANYEFLRVNGSTASVVAIAAGTANVAGISLHNTVTSYHIQNGGDGVLRFYKGASVAFQSNGWDFVSAGPVYVHGNTLQGMFQIGDMRYFAAYSGAYLSWLGTDGCWRFYQNNVEVFRTDPSGNTFTPGRTYSQNFGGGPGGAAQMVTYGANHTWNFRIDDGTGYVYMRVDEAYERRIWPQP